MATGFASSFMIFSLKISVLAAAWINEALDTIWIIAASKGSWTLFSPTICTSISHTALFSAPWTINMCGWSSLFFIVSIRDSFVTCATCASNLLISWLGTSSFVLQVFYRSIWPYNRCPKAARITVKLFWSTLFLCNDSLPGIGINVPRSIVFSFCSVERSLPSQYGSITTPWRSEISRLLNRATNCRLKLWNL